MANTFEERLAIVAAAVDIAEQRSANEIADGSLVPEDYWNKDKIYIPDEVAAKIKQKRAEKKAEFIKAKKEANTDVKVNIPALQNALFDFHKPILEEIHRIGNGLMLLEHYKKLSCIADQSRLEKELEILAHVGLIDTVSYRGQKVLRLSTNATTKFRREVDPKTANDAKKQRTTEFTILRNVFLGEILWDLLEKRLAKSEQEDKMVVTKNFFSSIAKATTFLKVPHKSFPERWKLLNELKRNNAYVRIIPKNDEIHVYLLDLYESTPKELIVRITNIYDHLLTKGFLNKEQIRVAGEHDNKFVKFLICTTSQARLAELSSESAVAIRSRYLSQKKLKYTYLDVTVFSYDLNENYFNSNHLSAEKKGGNKNGN